MKNLQEATEKICDLKGSILALDTLLSAFTYALPLEARAELMQRLQMHAEVARTALLLAEISEHTITAFERDVHRSMKMVEASLRPPPLTEDPPTPELDDDLLHFVSEHNAAWLRVVDAFRALPLT